MITTCTALLQRAPGHAQALNARWRTHGGAHTARARAPGHDCDWTHTHRDRHTGTRGAHTRAPKLTARSCCNMHSPVATRSPGATRTALLQHARPCCNAWPCCNTHGPVATRSALLQHARPCCNTHGPVAVLSCDEFVLACGRTGSQLHVVAAQCSAWPGCGRLALEARRQVHAVVGRVAAAVGGQLALVNVLRNRPRCSSATVQRSITCCSAGRHLATRCHTPPKAEQLI
jgi:hypothetical protein